MIGHLSQFPIASCSRLSSGFERLIAVLSLRHPCCVLCNVDGKTNGCHGVYQYLQNLSMSLIGTGMWQFDDRVFN